MSIIRAITWATVAASGISGGLLLGFSCLVMPGLRRIPASAAVQAMQAINLAAPRSGVLMVPLIGSAVGSAVVGVHALVTSSSSQRPLLVAGSVLGLAVIGITAAYHVPRNNALALVDPTDTTVAAAWAQYAAGWTAWNHVRSVAGLAAAAVLMIATVRAD